MLTRVRLEATGDDAEHVEIFLLEVWENVRSNTHGEWYIEDQDYLPSNEGYWGRLTMRKKKP